MNDLVLTEHGKRVLTIMGSMYEGDLRPLAAAIIEGPIDELGLPLWCLAQMIDEGLDDRFHEPDHGTGDLLVDSSFAVR